MPQMGYDMQEGTLVRWLKAVGDEVSLGEAVAEIETDKAVVEFESTAEGTILDLLVEEGTTVAVGEAIAMVGVEGEAAAVGETTQAEIPADSSDAGGSTGAERDGTASAAIPLPASSSEVRASPVARRLASERGVDIGGVQGTGPGGRVVKADVLAAETAPATPGVPEETTIEPSTDALGIPEKAAEPVRATHDVPEETPPAAPAPAVEQEPTPMPAPVTAEEGEIVPLSRMRKQIARVTVGSKTTIPHFYVTTDIDMTEAMALRRQINESIEDDVRVSVNDLVIKACVDTLKSYPKFNAHFTDDGIRMHESINVGIAIAEEDGLIMPAILGCESKSLTEISAASRDLIERSQSGTLRSEEYTGGTFSISNMGMFDVTSFVAIIQPPQSAVLAVGTVQKRPVIEGDGIVVREMMSVTLSADHRVSDGAEGAQFIVRVKECLEHPLRLLV